MSRSVRVAAVSPEIRIGDLEGNLARVRDALADAAARGAQLIVLPELATSGYVFRDGEEALTSSLSRDDPRWMPLHEALDGDCVAVIGYCERDGERLFNSAAVLGADGRLGDYRKSHLWGTEKLIFAEGDSAGLVVDTALGRLGVAICYDNEFPEVPRRLALAGADLLALPVNWPLVPRPEGEHAPEIIQAMAAARSSRLATVVADRAGEERGVPWTGGTTVIDDDGWIAAVAENGRAEATLTLRGPADKALPPHNDLFADRRPALY
ncbi:MAG TPA: nitrilase-related carbon-nitrogen hydrolase [Microbacterium sp.]|nr:nitrilase-related carbon-nitrogen hydrolase [Microbacterium sp.]